MSAFEISMDRLKGGVSQKIDLLVSSSFLGADEPELKFEKKTSLKGEAYLTDDHLIIHLAVKTEAMMPCAVCNEMTAVELKVDDFYHAEPVGQIKGPQFDYSEALREALLLELPKIAECQGKCPNRGTIEPYIRPKDRTYFPFAGMDDTK